MQFVTCMLPLHDLPSLKTELKLRLSLAFSVGEYLLKSKVALKNDGPSILPSLGCACCVMSNGTSYLLQVMA